MPEENAPQKDGEDESGSNGDAANNSGESSSSGPSTVSQYINDPYLLLTRAAYLFFALGVLFVFTDMFGFPAPAQGQWEGIFNDSFGVVAGTGFILGVIAIVNAVRRRKAGVEYSSPTDWQGRFTSAEWLFQFVPLLVIGIKMGQLILMLWDAGGSDWAIWRTFFSKMFTTTAAVLFMLTMKAVADAIDPSRSTFATASESDDEDEEEESSEDAESTEGSAEADSDDEKSDNSDDDESSESDGPGINDRLQGLVNDPSRLLTYGIVLLAYFGLLELIFTIQLNSDLRASFVWRQVFEQVAVVGGAVGLLLVARLIVSWLAHQSVASDQMAKGADESVGAWADRVLQQPKIGLDAAILVVAISGASFFLIDIWSDRNRTPSDFWRTLLEDGFYGLAGLGTLLILRALIPMLSNGMSGLRDAAQRAATGPTLDDPGRLLKLFTFALLYTGLAWVAVTQVSIREWADGWEIWYMFLLTLLITAVPVGISLGFQALYAELLEDSAPAE